MINSETGNERAERDGEGEEGEHGAERRCEVEVLVDVWSEERPALQRGDARVSSSRRDSRAGRKQQESRESHRQLTKF